jgi:hypothetical protein
MTFRRFPPPWTVDDPDMKLGQECFIVREANGHALAAGDYRMRLMANAAAIACLFLLMAMWLPTIMCSQMERILRL